MRNLTKYCTCSALAILAGVALTPSMASAQTGENVLDDEVVVTGSRVKSDGFSAPSPTTVLGENIVNDIAQPNIAAAIIQLPTLGDGITPESAGSEVGSGAQGANFLNLRGLGTNRTLVMLGGRRVVASSATGQVDINMLPTSLLKQVEVVTGGASAAWGSDAVAGVINFTLDTDYTGLKGSVQTGISEYSDAEEFRVDLSGGTSFADDRGSIIGSVNFADVNGVDRADSRDWFKGTKIINNPDFAPGNGQPQRVIRDNVGTFLGSDQGHVIGGPAAGLSFNNDGTVGTFDFGTRVGPLNINSTTPNDVAVASQVASEYEQINGFLHADFDFSADFTGYVEFSYGKTEAQSISVPYYRFGTARARRDNAFLPAAVADAYDNNPGPPFVPLALSNIQLGRATPTNDREVKRYVIGGDYNIDDNWEVSAYYQRGDSDIKNQVLNNAIRSNYDLALDSVLDANNNPICRSTLTDPNNGCAPLNVFGNGVASQAAIDYIIGTAVRDISLTQDVASISATGDMFELPAGPVSVAFGAEYRKEQVDTVADPISQADNFWVGNYKNAQGSYDVKEGFVEAVVPVFRDSEFGDSLDLNAAIRLSDYSTSGTVTTWKLGSTYDVAPGLRLRGTLSRDIRGPNLSEFFDGGQSNSVPVFDPEFNATNASAIRTLVGDPTLKPEKADSFNIGAVIQPEGIPGLRLSVDYFDIEINDAIGRIADNDIPQRCFDGEAAFCDLITRDPITNEITNFINPPVNFAVEKLTAFDFEASYGFEMAGGNVDLRSFWTYTTEHYLQDAASGNINTILGEIAGGNTPGASSGPTKIKGLNMLSYERDSGFRASLRHRLIGKGVLNADWVSGVDIDNNTIDSVNYFDLSLAQSFDVASGEVELFGGVDNLFDAQPPVAPAPSGPPFGSLGVSNRVHDLIGRYYRVGARFEF